MKIAICGLGKMGMQITRRLIQDGHDVVAFNRSPAKVDEAGTYGAIKAYSIEEAVSGFGDNKKIVWFMIPSDQVDIEVEKWLSHLKVKDILIDGGNSNFRLTQKRNEKIESRGVRFIDVGTSGGILGLKNGFSLMVGGDETAFQEIEPILKSLSKPKGEYKYFGASGSGHFVKMIHNAIEYGMMESLAEGYRLLKEGPYDKLSLVDAGSVWQKGSIISSSLNDLIVEALQENPNLDGIEGYVAESGEARWTLELAKSLNVELPSIQSAFNVRIDSQKGKVNFSTKLLSAMRNKFGGHSLNK
jgi:6-phosphogluconate dehydrogenase